MLDMVYTKKIDPTILIATARTLLEEEGADAVSMHRLAQEMQVRVSSLYHHFANKAHLMRAVTEESLRELALALVTARAGGGDDPLRQIHAMADDYFIWAMHHPQLYQMLFGDKPLEEDPTPIEMSVAEPMLASAASLVGAEHAVAATQSMWSLIHGFIMLTFAGQLRRGNPREGFRAGLNALLAGLPLIYQRQ
jgi:AcrR family transcriptional regulator